MLDLVTWNLNGLDPAEEGPRLEAALHQMILGNDLEALLRGGEPRSPPHVILLQEVTARSLRVHLQPHLNRAGYVLSAPPQADRSYFELVAVRPPLELIDHTSTPLIGTMFGRELHKVTLRADGETYQVLTAHFDSGPERAASDARRMQLQAVSTHLVGQSLFAGDTNLREKEWTRTELLEPVVDAWSSAGAPLDARFTWYGGKARARYDRVLLSERGRATHFELLGEKPVPGLNRPPSDHCGIRVKVEWTPLQ